MNIDPEHSLGFTFLAASAEVDGSVQYVESGVSGHNCPAHEYFGNILNAFSRFMARSSYLLSQHASRACPMEADVPYGTSVPNTIWDEPASVFKPCIAIGFADPAVS